MPKRVWFLVLLMGVAVLALAVACGGGGEKKTAAGPSVEITSPKGVGPIKAGDLKVEVKVSNFEVVDKLVGITPACPSSSACPNEPGKGHIHFYLLKPDEAIPTAPGQAAITAEGTYHATATTTYTWPGVKAGTYKVAVQLVNSDHTPLSRPVVKEIKVTVTGSSDAGGGASTPSSGY